MNETYSRESCSNDASKKLTYDVTGSQRRGQSTGQHYAEGNGRIEVTATETAS
jgi:hypothetical protein